MIVIRFLFSFCFNPFAFYNFQVNTTKKEYDPKIVISACRLIGLSVSKILWRIEFQGLENIPDDLESGLIVTPNHQIYIDPVWICLKLDRKFRFMAWDDLLKWFLIGRLIKYIDALPVGLNRKGFINTKFA